MRNIALIGFMGTGKTSVGLCLASALRWEFIDTDSLIEQKMGMSIPEIFQQLGEKRFRSEEKMVVEEVADKDNQVISTGGGVVLNKDNITCLHRSSVLICLKADPQIIFKRVGKDSSRPLLAGKDPIKNIIKLLETRESYYQCADLYIDTSEITIERTAEKILSELSKWGVSDVRINKN